MMHFSVGDNFVLLIPFWMTVTEPQCQIMSHGKLPSGSLMLFTNFYVDGFDHVPELQ